MNEKFSANIYELNKNDERKMNNQVTLTVTPAGKWKSIKLPETIKKIYR